MRDIPSSRREFLGGAAAAASAVLLDGCRPIGDGSGALVMRAAESPERKQIPTVELHRHFEAGMSPETIARLAQKNGIHQVFTRNGKAAIRGIDPQDPESIRNYYQRMSTTFTDPKVGFGNFLDTLGVSVSVMRTLEDIQTAAYQQMTEQAAEGSIHTELRGSPYTYQENLATHASLEEIIHAISRGIDQAYAKHGASGSYIACFSRNKADKYGQAVVDAVLKTHTTDQPIGLDIAGGPEDKFPPALFEKLLQPVREADVPITIHAGEQSKPPLFKESPASFIRDAIEKLGARRIGHGTSLITDPVLIALVKEKKIGIEACPASNNALEYMPAADHPLKRFLSSGVLVTANTDDAYVFGVSSVRDMLAQFREPLKLSQTDLVEIARNGIATAFVTPQRRAELKKKLAKILQL